jgi:hypothetical protein
MKERVHPTPNSGCDDPNEAKVTASIQDPTSDVCQRSKLSAYPLIPSKSTKLPVASSNHIRTSHCRKCSRVIPKEDDDEEYQMMDPSNKIKITDSSDISASPMKVVPLLKPHAAPRSSPFFAHENLYV